MTIKHSVQTASDLGIVVASGVSSIGKLVSHFHYNGTEKELTHILIGNNVLNNSKNLDKINILISNYQSKLKSLVSNDNMITMIIINVSIENSNKLINDLVNYFENKSEVDNKKTCESWGCLQKTGCAYINKGSVNVYKKKIKKIALEECIIYPTQTQDVNEEPPLEYYINIGEGYNKYNKLLDVTGLRLKEMKENNIIYQILSFTSAGIQNLYFYEDQVKKAKQYNNYMYKQIKNNPTKFKAFATLPMQDPVQATLELERCVKKLGFLGALINGNDVKYNKDGTKNVALFYDTPDYDILWAKFVELDVPIYIHPRVYYTPTTTSPDPLMTDLYNQFPQFPGSAWGFSINLAQHVLRLVLSGVFDRFPNLKLILGHLGEALPWWAERFDHRLCVYKNELLQISKAKFKELGLPIFNIPKLTLTQYLKKNIYVTTSGWFSNDALEYVIKIMGIDRVMFSIDYPYENQYLASDWIDNLPLSHEHKEKIAYKTAAKLLKLHVD